jgi:hypothetical protein
MPIEIVNVADLEDPNDPDGRSYRDVNAEKVHEIPLGTFVELQDGCRAWVVSLGRDCDQTPLYWLSLDKDDTRQILPKMSNPGWNGGYSADSLQILTKSE